MARPDHTGSLNRARNPRILVQGSMRSDTPFGKAILPGRSWCGGLVPDAHGAQSAGDSGWKSLGSNLRKKQYDEIVRQLLPKDRAELWDRCERDSWRPVRTTAYDWTLAEVALKAKKDTRDLPIVYFCG